MNFYEEIAQELKAAGLTGSKIFRILNKKQEREYSFSCLLFYSVVLR